MANVTSMSAPRRGSFWATWRVFAAGVPRVWTLVILSAGMAGPLVFWSFHKAIAFPPCAFAVTACVAFATWQFEGEMGERLAFMRMVAQPVDTTRLVLAPMCALGVFVTAVIAIRVRLPAAATLSLLGTAWWAAAGTRWLWKLRFWPVFALPILIVDPAAVYAMHRIAGWGGAAVVSGVLAIGALAVQPRPYVGEPLSRMLESGDARPALRARTPRGAISPAPGDTRWLASAVRFMRLVHGGPLFGIACLLTASLGLLFPVLGQHGDALMWPAVLSGNAMSRACGGDMYEFLRTRPFDGAQRFVGGLLPPLMLALLAPITALCFVNLEWFNHAGLIGLFKHQTLSADDLRYVREVLGATFMPEKWPAEGLSTDLWVRLRPFLYIDVLRTALLIAALFFAVPIAKAGEKPGPRSLSLGNVAILLIAFATMLRVGLFRLYPALPIPRLWFLALLAAVSIAHWVWRLRVVSAPAAKGSSTSG